MSATDRVYRWLLRAYPARFRAEYSREMRLLVRDLRRAPRSAGARFWIWLLWDIARSAPAERLAAWDARTDDTLLRWEDAMRPMAMLVMLAGLFEAANAMVEGWAGGVTHGDGLSLAAGALGMAAGALLVAAGAAVWRRGPRWVWWARAGALGCLTLFALLGVAVPRLSGFAMLLGVAMPVALLVAARRRDDAQPPRATMA